VNAKLLSLALFGLGLCSCHAPPHIFAVTIDEGATEALLELNGTSVKLAERNGRFAGDSSVADGSGKIIVKLKSGKIVICTIGYITNGEVEPHNFAVKNGVCSGS
jgi:hypothetical protein